MFRPTRAIVDRSKIQSNFRNLRKLAGPGFFCPMVKADAYGHGAVEVVRWIAKEGAERVGVALVEEGIHLRQSNIKTEILVFGRLTPDSAKAVIEFGLTPVLSSWADLEILSAVAPEKPVRMHVKINTGMNRMGFSTEDIPRLRRFFTQGKKLKCVGLCTHLSHGHDAADPNGLTAKQIERFKNAFELFGDPSVSPHVLNSEALLTRADAGMDNSGLGARPGLALYGLYDSTWVSPAMSLVTKVDLIRRVEKGENISYGGRWTASKRSWIAIVPVGYGDGYWRLFSNKSMMLYREKRVPVVGSVCMDYSLLDLTNACDEREPELGEDVVVFGSQGKASVTVIELTKLADTIPYELVTGLSSRVPRVYR